MQMPGETLYAAGTGLGHGETDMKPSDADLIQQLKALSEEDLANLLEFLGANEAAPGTDEHFLDLLSASIALHRKPDSEQQH